MLSKQELHAAVSQALEQYELPFKLLGLLVDDVTGAIVEAELEVMQGFEREQQTD